MRRISKWLAAGVGLALMLAGAAAFAADTLDWRAKQNKVDADIQSWDLSTLLKKIARQTGWKVYVERGAATSVSVKFKDLPGDEALRRLLGTLNFSKDQTNGVTRLFVYRTLAKAATQVVAAEKKDYRIANEDLVKLKHGATNSIDELAKKVGAKILGRDDRVGLYRLQFADADSAAAGLQSLAADPSVAVADGNYSVDRPTPAQMTQIPNPAGPLFNLTAQPSANGPIIGLVDTSVDPPSQFSPYMLTPINVTGEDDPPGDEPSHGTSMLETMVEAMSDYPGKILPVDVYGSGDSTTTFELADGIIKAAQEGANPISVSSGGTGDSSILRDVVAQAIQQNLIIFGAAGNTPGEGDVFPAMYPGVISVTASTQTVNGPITSSSASSTQLASYANDPAGTLVMAPGTSIIQWNGEAWEVEGTSPATAATSATIVDLANQNHISLSQAVDLVIRASPAPAK
jgi:Subtilase family